MSEVIIKVDNLHKTYQSGLLKKRKVEALKGVSFEVKKGDIFGLLGPNGAGKTTCIKVMLGICAKTSGEATLFGRMAGDQNTRLRIGYLPEHHRIPLHHTANSAMKFYGSLCNMAAHEITTKTVELLELVGLGEWGDHPVKKFSKGMQQRLGLAQAMLHSPDLLILDEPTDGVDPKGRADIRDILKNLQNKGVTLFINSHLLQEMELICDNIIIFEKGEVIHSSTVEEMTGASNNAVLLQVVASKAQITKALSTKKFEVQEAKAQPTQLSISIENQESLDQCIDELRAAKISIMEIRNDQKSLEDAFLNIVNGAK